VIARVNGLKSLNLAFNPFSDEPLVFPPSLSSLTDLCLWKCSLPVLDDSMSLLTSLTSLNLEENKLRLLPDAMVKLRQLKVLKAAENIICGLPRRFGQLHHMTELNLEHNNLEFLPPSLGKLVALKSLNLARNKICLLDDFITELFNLEFLNLQGNALSFLPLNMGKLKCKSIWLALNRCVRTVVASCNKSGPHDLWECLQARVSRRDFSVPQSVRIPPIPQARLE
jgi:Leucine-rich repeat (LRR) protein